MKQTVQKKSSTCEPFGMTHKYYLALACTDSCSVVTVCPTDTLANDVVKVLVNVTNFSSNVPSKSAIK